MLRSVTSIAAAIALSQPGMSTTTKRRYAEVVQQEARRRHFDPFTLVAIAHNESRWNASLVGGLDGKCHGLGQVCVQYVYPYCRGELYDSKQCLQKRAELLNGVVGIRTTAWLIEENRKVCRRITGHPALFARWLSSYQGFNNRPGRTGVWCNMRQDRRGIWRDVKVPKLTRKVMNYRLKLVRMFGK